MEAGMKTPLAERAMAILREYCDTVHNGNVRATAAAIGLDPTAGVLNRWLAGSQWPRLDLIGACLDRIGAEIVAPWEGKSDAPTSETVARLQEELARSRREMERARESIAELRGEVKALERVLTRERAGEKNFIS